MNKINVNAAFDYIKNIHNYNKESLNVSIFDEAKKQILKEEIFRGRFVKKYIIDSIDRNIENFKFTNFEIDEGQISNIINYIEKIKDKDFFIYFNEAIEENFINSGFSENIDELLLIVSLISSILTFLHILELYKEDEKMLIVKKRDKQKIKNAIDLLSIYSNDSNVLHYLKIIDIYEKEISRETLLSCFFCSITKNISETFPKMTNYKNEELAKEIMYYIFDSKKEYRIYKNIEKIEYKGYFLKRYTTK
jgi:hypothetical protein